MFINTTKRIDAILFDMGGTLRRTLQKKDEKRRLQGVEQIMQLLGTVSRPVDRSLAEFSSLLSIRSKAYKQWAEQTLHELSEVEIWTRWMLPDWPYEIITALTPQLSQLWHLAIGTRTILPETKPVVLELFRRGYRLGLISNTTSQSNALQLLQNTGLFDYFDTVLLSTKFGWRKPHPSIFIAASAAMMVPPERCAYVGDRPDRDVAGCRQAGFTKAIILQDPSKIASPVEEGSSKQELETPGDPLLKPDHMIDSLIELLDIFPPRYRPPLPDMMDHPIHKPPERAQLLATPPEPAQVWDASLSSMWGLSSKDHPGWSEYLPDFFEQARRLGFTRFELNHQVDSDMLAGLELGLYQFNSLHEPCPADVPMPVLKEHDWLISSLDEENRRQGVRMIKRTINLACDIGVKVVVVHSGTVNIDTTLENQLRRLFEQEQSGSPEYLDLKEKLVQARAQQSAACLEAAQKSLRELIDYAGQYHIRLGLENRYHYLDIPLLDEMQALLDLADSEALGFWYDVGHAQNLDRLGFFPHEEWLKRYATRIIGVHLHDARGITDHLAPGLGEVDFAWLASYLPPQALRTCEFKPCNTPEQIQAGMQVLLQTGCIKALPAN